MIESPLGRLVGASTFTGAKGGGCSIEELDAGFGRRSSPPAKLKTSKENARSRPWKMGKSESAEALLSTFPPFIELRSEKSNVEGSRSTEKTLVLAWEGSSIAEVSETFVSFVGSNGGMYDTFLVGLTSMELPASNGDGTGSGQGTDEVELIIVSCLPLSTEWFNV